MSKKERLFCDFLRKELKSWKKPLADMYLQTERSKNPEIERGAVICYDSKGEDAWIERVRGGKRKNGAMKFDLSKYCYKEKGVPIGFVHTHHPSGLGIGIDEKKAKVEVLGIVGTIGLSPKDIETLKRKDSPMAFIGAVGRAGFPRDKNIVLAGAEIDKTGKIHRCRITLAKNVPYSGWITKTIQEAEKRIQKGRKIEELTF